MSDDFSNMFDANVPSRSAVTSQQAIEEAMRENRDTGGRHSSQSSADR